MSHKDFRRLLVSVGWLAIAVPVWAHHAFSVAYDANKPVTVEGVITEVRWENPHSRIYVDVMDASGKVVNWGFEGLPPNPLRRTGVTAAMLKPGVRVTIRGYQVRDASQTFGAVSEVVFPDGKAYYIGAGGTPRPNNNPVPATTNR